MKNNTKSVISIEMKHIDNATKLFDFLHYVKLFASMGGDL